VRLKKGIKEQREIFSGSLLNWGRFVGKNAIFPKI